MAAVLSRRRAPFLVAALVLVAGVVALVLLLRGGGDDGGGRKAASVEPLAYVPDAGNDAVLDLDTRAPLVDLAVEQLAPRLTHGALSAEQVRPLVGGRAVVALRGDRAWLVFATDAPAPRVRQGAVAAKREGVVVVAPSRADLDASVQAAAKPAARYSRATFDKRFAGLPAKGSVRVAFDPRKLLASRAPQLATTRWASSLRDGAAVLTVNGTRLALPFKITADPVGLSADDLPIATGVQPPTARGSGPLVIGLRDPARTLQFARDTGVLSELDLVDQLPGFLKPNLGDLGPNGTVTTPSLDLDHLTLRAEPRDPGDWSSKLGRLDALSGIAKRAGIDIDIDHHDGAYDISQNGRLVSRAGVFGRALTLSNDSNANLRAAAAAPTTPPPPKAAGALTLRARAKALIANLPALISARLGDITGWARAELTGITGELQLALR
ncbi:MAG: hypothetical protein V7607_5578 [Solirubrobacteraceae bacterium]